MSTKINCTPCGLTFYSCAECADSDIQWLLKMMDVAKKKYLTAETERGLEAEDCPCSSTPSFRNYLNSQYEPDCTPYEDFKKAKLIIEKELGY